MEYVKVKLKENKVITIIEGDEIYVLCFRISLC